MASANPPTYQVSLFDSFTVSVNRDTPKSELVFVSHTNRTIRIKTVTDIRYTKIPFYVFNKQNLINRCFHLLGSLVVLHCFRPDNDRVV